MAEIGSWALSVRAHGLAVSFIRNAVVRSVLRSSGRLGESYEFSEGPRQYRLPKI